MRERTQSYWLFKGGLTVSTFRTFSNLVFTALIVLLTAPVEAQRPSAPVTDLVDSRTLKVQRKVDELYERGEFDRAYFIYRNELAPVGDKYAQYMVGYMHLMGMGTDRDPVAASAWYRLAAERQMPEFVAVRNQLMRDLNADERRRSDAYYLELRREFNDLVILLAEIKRNLPERRVVTGSRISTESSTIGVFTITPGQARSSADYHASNRRQLEESLKKLAELGDFPDLETDPDRVDIDEIERLVKERIESPEG